MSSRESSPNALLMGAIEDWNDLEKEYIQLEVTFVCVCVTVSLNYFIEFF